MNKTEKQLLANIVSEMMYSYNSERQTVRYGEELLEYFPSIKSLVTDAKSVEDIYNLIKVFDSYLTDLSTTFSKCAPHDKLIYGLFINRDVYYDLFDDWLVEQECSAEELAEELDNNSCRSKTLEFIINCPLWNNYVDNTDNLTVDQKMFLKGEFTLRGEDK